MSSNYTPDRARSAFLPVALIGDIVGSRTLADRATVQDRLQSALEDLAVEPDIQPVSLAPLALTAGDELQGLFLDPSAVVRIVVTLSETLFPVRIVYGLGRGELTTRLGPRVALLDGPCFHLARTALEAAGKGDSWLVASGLGEPADSVVTALFGLQGALRARWTARQSEIARAVRRALAGGRTRRDVADDLGVSPSVVTESLQAAAFEALRRGEAAAVRALQEFAFYTEIDHYSPSSTNPAGEKRLVPEDR